MKVKNLNNSSRNTRILIRKVFAEMLCDKKELSKISISELCKKADISRGTFYSHYDDIYKVAEEYENELIDTFFDKTRLIKSQDISEFIDSIFQYIRENDYNYRLLCKSNDFIFTAKKLTMISTNKLLELCKSNMMIASDNFIELDIQIFIEGLFCEYVKYCRGYSKITLDNLYEYTKYWVSNFIKKYSL